MHDLLAALFGVVATTTVAATATLRALIYLVPLVVLMTLYRGNQHVLMKLALAAYSSTALVSAIGVSRDTASLLSIVPTSLLGAAIVTWATRPHAS